MFPVLELRFTTHNNISILYNCCMFLYKIFNFIHIIAVWLEVDWNISQFRVLMLTRYKTLRRQLMRCNWWAVACARVSTGVTGRPAGTYYPRFPSLLTKVLLSSQKLSLSQLVKSVLPFYKISYNLNLNYLICLYSHFSFFCYQLQSKPCFTNLVSICNATLTRALRHSAHWRWRDPAII